MPHVYDLANVGISDASGDGTLKPDAITKYLLRCSKYLVPSLDLHLGWKWLKAANAEGCLSWQGRECLSWIELAYTLGSGWIMIFTRTKTLMLIFALPPVPGSLSREICLIYVCSIWILFRSEPIMSKPMPCFSYVAKSCLINRIMRRARMKGKGND